MGRVGVFDSGIGGLSVWREIRRGHPHLETEYVADQAHLPYGARTKAQVLAYSRGITHFLVERGCKAVVIACNTASAVALQHLRQEFPGREFVGMEPAVKPAAELSRRGVVGVLGTQATLEGELFQGTLERHAADLVVVRQACPGLVECIEAGETQGPRLDALLRRFLEAPLAAGADVLVLACTHYPLVRRSIERLAGPTVHVIDPAPAIARQLGRRLGRASAGAASGTEWFGTTGNAASFAAAAGAILGRSVQADSLVWSVGEATGSTQQLALQNEANAKGAATAAPFQDPPGLSS